MAVSARTYELDIWNLNTQIALIRYSLRYLSRTPQSRAEFIHERTEQILAGSRHFAQTEPEQFCGFEHFLVPTFARKESDWIQTNLRAVIEFSEHRLNQMELVVRYAFFEAVLTDVVGNILWEYPNLIENEVHKSLGVRNMPHAHEDREDFRGWRTEKLVESVDKLTYKPTSKTLARKQGKPNRPACLCEYLKQGINLEFKQWNFSDILEKVHEARNKIAHRSNLSPFVLTDEFMGQARSTLSEFPRRLIQVAANQYPEACTTEGLGGESERPGYLIRKVLKDI